MKKLFNALFIFMILGVFLFIGSSSVMAFSSELMIVNQIDSQSMVTAECPDRDSLNLKNYKNTAANVNYTSLPTPTFHVGKIHRSLV